MNVTVTINIPGQETHTYSISPDNAKLEAKQNQINRDTTTSSQQPTKKRKTNTSGQVKSSVADRSQGPGIDPTSRFSYVYTGKHDHGQLESEVSRRDSDKWTGLSDAMSHMKRHCDSHLTKLLAQQEEAAKPQETEKSQDTSTSTSSSSSSKK